MFSGLLYLTDEADLVVQSLIIFFFVYLEHFDPVVGNSNAVFCLDQMLYGSEIRLLF